MPQELEKPYFLHHGILITFSVAAKLFFIRKLTLHGVWLCFHYFDLIFLIMFANPRKRRRRGKKVERWKNRQFPELLLEAYNRDFLIGLFVCFAFKVRNFLPKTIEPILN